MRYKIFPLGDHALTVEFGSEISIETNNLVVSLTAEFDKNPFDGLIELVPAYASLTCFYDVSAVRKSFPDKHSAFEAVKSFIENVLQNLDDQPESTSRLIEIPVCFDAKYALDLESIAERINLSPERIVEIFLARTYRVFMLGFLPGFAYMGEVDKQIAVPRKDSPRLAVPKGSVGIAGKQTGIYSLESPGGWQIIGRTNLEMFTPNEESPTLLQTGDSIKFRRAAF